MGLRMSGKLTLGAAALVALPVVAMVVGRSDSAHAAGPAATGTSDAGTRTQAVPAARVVVMAVGDLTSSATNRNAVAVRNVVAAAKPARILMLGDYQYKYGSAGAIRGGADRLWGPKPAGLWRKIMPTSGPTHDVRGCKPSDYDRYWGRSAMRPYSFDVGYWHIIQLPSAAYRYKCNTVGVLAWLKKDLATHHNQCTLAYWHEPYWTRNTATHKRVTTFKPWITALYGAGVDVVLNGHQHNYQRFKPQNPSGGIDARKGIREFVVGSGGIGFYKFTSGPGNTAASDATTFGALRLVLRRGAYDWRFVRAAGGRFTDAGTAACH